jgi:hypothetical protein
MADGWYPIGTNPQNLLDTLPRLHAGIDRLHKLVREAGRDPSSVAIAFRVPSHGKAAQARADNGDRRLFSGEPADIAGDLVALRDAGVSHVDFTFGGATADEAIGAMRRFRDEVIARA